MKKKILFICLLAAALICLSAAAFAEVAVNISFDKESVAVGETITANYEITGLDAVDSIFGEWMVTLSDGRSQGAGELYESTALSGSISCTPTAGAYIQLLLYIEDTAGNYHDTESERIPIISEEPGVKISFDKTRLKIGETITANYEITGISGVDSVYGDWIVTMADGKSQSAGSFESSQASGSASCTPTAGASIQLLMYVSDQDGNFYDVESEQIPMISSEPEIHISFDKSEGILGEPITANYEITGLDGVDVICGDWIITMENGKSQSAGSFEAWEMSGSAAFVPAAGTGIQLFLYVTDLGGNFYDAESEIIPLHEPVVNIFTLPDAVKHIRAEAFAGLNCTEVICPEGIELIGSRAFAGCGSMESITIPAEDVHIAADAFQGCPNDMLIVAPAGSTAEAHAEAYGYSFRAM